jgi:hypothetical protein
MPSNPLAVAPILMVSDFNASLAYWRDKVGFDGETWGDPPGFAILQRGGARICLAHADDGATIVPNWRLSEKMSNVYVWVDDAKALYEELKARGAIIDWDLYEAPYGVLEFGIQDLDDQDIAFGQVLR